MGVKAAAKLGGTWSMAPTRGCHLLQGLVAVCDEAMAGEDLFRRHMPLRHPQHRKPKSYRGGDVTYMKGLADTLQSLRWAFKITGPDSG